MVFLRLVHDSHQILTLIGLGLSWSPSVINTLVLSLGLVSPTSLGVICLELDNRVTTIILATIKIKYKGSIVKLPYLCKFNVSFLLDS